MSIWTLLFLGLLIWEPHFLTTPCHGKTSILCIESERQALLRFKQDLKDPGNILKSWSAAELDCCNWTGILCDSLTGYVEELQLSNYIIGNVQEKSRLRGKINLSLLELKHLKLLDLSYNDFGGIPIPSLIGSLVNLRYLKLSRAGFKGLVPHQLGNLSGLRYLVVQGNWEKDDKKSLYVENLDWLSNLPSLLHLDLSNVNLSGVSDWLLKINTLPSLLELHLSDTALSRIPTLSTVNFTSLSVLDLSSNHFHTSVPKWIFTLDNLVSIDLVLCYFTGPIPTYFSNLTSLTLIDFSFNNFEGPILKYLSNFTSLRKLHLSENQIVDSFGTYFSNLTSLTTLDLHQNKFHGPIPNYFSDLTSLTYLDLSENYFNGSIPESLPSMTSLYRLDFSKNQLTGTFPRGLGNLSYLENFSIAVNRLEGDVYEAHFANLTSLKIFMASNNFFRLRVSPTWVPPFRLQALGLRNWDLGPQFPTWIRSHDYLTYLDLSCTRISDRIPNWLWNMTSQMHYLNLSRNQIQGELPEYLSAKLWSQQISLAFNQLQGPLPRISQYLTVLDLSNNFFSGSISRILCDQTAVSNELAVLNLGGNRLSGEIPNCWINWPSLRAIKLGDNNLSGSLPSTLGYLQKLRLLDLRSNILSGNIPVSLRNCTGLWALDLGFNDFVGKVPTWLDSSFRYLKVLNLRSNMLKSEIPSEICHLKSLHILDIAHNSLLGSIPKCFSNLTAMVHTQTYDSRFFWSGSTWSGSYFMSDWEWAYAFMVVKGRNGEYSTILSLTTGIDFSNNNLSGEIPEEITALIVLMSLNLSGNHLTGEIPSNIGDMKALESIDLSKNKITGRIPPSMANLNFLSYMNLSYNNLSGEIPSGTQLQSLEASSYVGNNLCGAPLTVSCKKSDTPQSKVDENEKEANDDGAKIDEFYLGLVLGFVVGFWGIFGPLLYCKSWRHAYFQFLNKIWIKLQSR